MWALTAAPIQNAEALRMLQQYRDVQGLQSNSWLLPRHLTLFGVRERHPARLLLPAADLLTSPPRAVPFTALQPSWQHRLLHECPPPMVPLGRCAFLERSAGSLRWRAATVAECFDAAFVRGGTSFAHSFLLCDPTFAGTVTLPDEVAVLNAQETSNPFVIDTGLAHRSLVDGSPLTDSISSALTTIAAQFGYTSFHWVEAGECAQLGLPLRPSATPHTVNCVETLRVVHVSQLPMARQEELVIGVPRYVLLKGSKCAFVHTGDAWRSERSLELLTRLRRDDIPPDESSGEVSNTLLLWVDAAEEDAFCGSVTVRERNIHRKYFNAQQLEDMKATLSTRTLDSESFPSTTAAAAATTAARAT